VRKIREILRLRCDSGLSARQISKSCGLARSTVADYLRRARECGLAWPLPDGLDDAELERRLFPPLPAAADSPRPEPNWRVIHKELRRKGVTLSLLWQEYRAVYTDGYQYSWFCEHYRRWAGKVDLVMRQEHRAGEKLFVDYAGQTVEVVNRHTGEMREAQIFVAVLGASSYAYAEATWTQTLPDWIGSHVRALTFLGGCPEILVPDNLKSGVTSPHLYEPDLNPTYQDMAAHYHVAVIPARSAKPKDKAKVEVGVQVVERWILARLRNITFFSLAELKEAIADLLVDLNGRPFQKIPGSRRELFEELDKPALAPLPSVPYEYAEWKKASVHIDYHVEADAHYYSVPYQLVGQKLDVRLTAGVIEVFHKGKRVASHQRCYDPRRRYITLPEHMPKSHQEHAEWTPERLVRWAQKTGPAMARVVETILINRPHPQQGFRSCLGVMRLGKKYGEDRLEAACQRALAINACSYKSIDSILKNGLERQPLPEAAETAQPLEHPNIRGARYYR
jgi:transposase